jgi:rare lipoprotein A
MYVPATPALTVTALPPNAIAADEATQPPVTVAPQVTRLLIRSAVLNVLDGRTASIAGSLRVTARRGTLQSVGHSQVGTNRSASTSPPAGAPQSLGASSPAGAAHPADIAARILKLQALGHRGWRTIAVARTGADGHFRLRYRADRIGSEPLRVRFAGAPGEDGSERAVGRLNVYRLAEASWYGGEGSLACGGWLTSATLGVANKTLPCGTLVTLRYDGRTVRVPVIDRGPYVAGREYDLTEATKRALGFEGVGEVWATS